MLILGIDRKKCTNCRSCVPECVALRFVLDKNTNNVKFHEDWGCISCGHCIAICPEDAILREEMDGQTIEFKEIQNIGSIIPFENLHQLLRCKRSIRQYKKEIVPKEMLNHVLDSMKYAPTGVNIRTLKCTLLSGKEKIQQLSNDITEKIFEDPNVSESNKWVMKTKSEMGIDPIFHKAPHVIILHSPELELVNATIAITYGMLAAESMGLGTCWIGWAQDPLNTFVNIRKDILGFTDYVSGVFTIGFPRVKYKRCPTRPKLNTNWLN
ncbi:MAG: nitroreductase family protein [Candidatus Thorarchaeota archaeon]